MRLLLDTHVFLWCVKDDRRLTKAARASFSGATEIYKGAAPTKGRSDNAWLCDLC